MRLPSKLLPGLLFFALLILATDARAEHIVITSGSAGHNNPVLYAFPGHGFNFAGDNFSARGGDEKLGDGGIGMRCFPCQRGQTFSMSSHITRFTTSYPGFATYNGTNYTNLLFQGSELNFIVAPVVIPLDATTGFTLTSTFTFEGTLIGLQMPDRGEVFSMTLSGQGIATLRFVASQIGGFPGYAFDGVTYTFQPAAAVPEPATLLLLGTGLAGAGANMRRRRRRTASAHDATTADAL